MRSQRRPAVLLTAAELTVRPIALRRFTAAFSMLFQAVADLVVFVHLAFIVFVVLGGVFALRWRWIPWLHLPALLWSALLEFCGWMCPLTPLENWLRRAGGASAYTGGFVEQYVLPIVYPSALTRAAQVALGLLVCFVNAAIYLRLWRVRRGRVAPLPRARGAGSR